MAVEGMHSLKLSESKFKNWIKAGLSVLFTKEGIEPFVNHEIQQFQQKCLSDICNNNGLPVGTTCSSCCTENVVACPTNRKCNEGRGKCNFHRHSAIKFQPSGCPNKICDNFKKEIQNAHRFCGPSFINTTATQWCSNPWEVAKCFMSPDGYKDVTSAAETNFHGISSVIINNKAFESKIHDDLWKKNNIFVKAREIGNAVRESSYLQVEDRDLQQYFSTLQNLLSDPGYLADNTASQNANKKLSQLQQNILVIEINDIRKVLNDADKIVQDELRTIKDKHKKETEKQMLDLIVITNKFVSDFERQGKVSMSELDNAIKRAINETIQSSAKKELQIKVKEEAFIRKDTECLQRIEKEFDYGTERDSFKTVHAKRKRKEENTNVEVKRPKNEPSQKFQPLETCEKVTKTASNTINHREEVRNSGTDANAGIENIAPETETATKQLKVVDVKEADFGVENIVSYPNKVLPQRGETLVTAKEEDKTDIDIIPSDVDLHNIAQAIGQNWELLGPNFGLSKTRIDRIKIDCHGSLTRIFQMLHIWRQDQGPEGTIRNLFSVFRNQQSACIDWDALSRIFRNIEGCRPVIATEDNERYLRHLWFLGDGGLLVLKGVLTREEKRCGQSLENKISVNRASFQNMLEEELFKLFPSPLTVNGDVKTLDMSLLITVVKKLFWASLSPAEQSSVQTLKTYSNNIQGNPTNMSMGTIDFDTNWRIVGAALQQLASGISPPAANEIAELKKRAVSGTFDIKWILQHIKEMQAFKPSLLDALENKFRKSENLDLGSKLNDIKGNIDTMEKRNQKRHWEVSNSLNELHTTAKSSKQDITEIKDIAERSKNLHENDRDTIRHIAGVLDEHTNRTKHIEEMLEKITGKSPGKENQHDIETVMLIDSDTPENTSEAQQTIMATASDILDKLKGTEANIVEDKDVIEAILQNVKDLRNRELAEALLEYIKEYLKHGSILQIKEGSIRLTIRLKSYKGLLNLIQFLNSESLQRHLNDIGRALEMRNGHAVTISSHIAHESLHNLYKHLVEECEKLELTRKVILPVKCKNIEGLSNIWNLIQKGGANRHMERISDILTKKIGDKITVTTVVNVKQFEQTLLEIDKGSRNDMDNYADLLKAMSTLALDDDKTEKSTDESESGIMASDDLENHLYKNWVRGAKSLEYLQEGLQDFVGNKVQHCRNQTLQKIINSLPTGSTRQCNLCTSQNLLPEHAKKKKACNRSTCIEKFPNNCFGSKPNCRRKCPNGICSKFYDEIVLEHSSRDPLWKNTDPSTWCSDPLGWSFGKCFQTTTGPGSSASKTDAGGLLCILINNLTVQNNWLASNDMLKETCPFNRARVIRNAILHSSKLELDDLTLGYYLDTFITVLQDEKCLINCNGSKQAVHKLLQGICFEKEEKRPVQAIWDYSNKRHIYRTWHDTLF
ncbi:uncharacterized protein LOC128550984 [Mercenaria mercenaria]|uniref:uncharacterized protein LOC128550984 n=1 Tax=Mercenaria mercenaria TaxID=6596 RepID=UPI00234F7FE9|nr:uncharacterized protein LOC128550984 [Mercenaria mercenaria]